MMAAHGPEGWCRLVISEPNRWQCRPIKAKVHTLTRDHPTVVLVVCALAIVSVLRSIRDV